MVGPASREKLARLLRTARGSKSQRAFAQELGVSYTAIQLWESGKAYPELENLEKIAKNTYFLSLQNLLNYLESDESDIDKMLNLIIKQIERMPKEHLTLVGQAVIKRLGVL